MIVQVTADLLLFGAFCLGGGLLAATFVRGFGALDRLSLGIGAALVALYVANFSIYLLHLPVRTLWVAGAAALAAGWFRRGSLVALWRERIVRVVLRNWLLLALWCLGWQMLVFSYSGGRWAGDWQEHYDRAHFFIQHWPKDYLFIQAYPLPARPPLANLVTGGFLGLAGGRFFHFQVFSTLLSTLVFFPLAGRLHGLRPGIRPQVVLLVLLMLSPLLIQNSTFPWTKLVVAFFIVLAADLLVRPTAAASARTLPWALGALAVALITHYSAFVWVVALAAGWLAVYHARLREPATRRDLAIGLVLGILMCATWFGWSLATYGTGVTLSVNVTTGLAEPITLAERVANVIGNTYRTLVPAWLWEGLPSTMDQVNPLARLRDRWFCLYQLNLPFAFGVGGVLVLARLLGSHRTGETARFWYVAGPVAVVLNAAVHHPDTIGLTHLALQPLVLLGLVWLASCASDLPPIWLRVWRIGLAVDFIFGLALQSGVQSLWLDRVVQPGRTDIDYIRQLSWPAASNYYGKLRIGAQHLADGLHPAVALALLLAAGLAAFLLQRRGRSEGVHE